MTSTIRKIIDEQDICLVNLIFNGASNTALFESGDLVFSSCFSVNDKIYMPLNSRETFLRLVTKTSSIATAEIYKTPITIEDEAIPEERYDPMYSLLDKYFFLFEEIRERAISSGKDGYEAIKNVSKDYENNQIVPD